MGQARSCPLEALVVVDITFPLVIAQCCLPKTLSLLDFTLWWTEADNRSERIENKSLLEGLFIYDLTTDAYIISIIIMSTAALALVGTLLTLRFEIGALKEPTQQRLPLYVRTTKDYTRLL